MFINFYLILVLIKIFTFRWRLYFSIISSNLVEVKGEVNRPYTYEVKNSDNLKDLIVFIGGYTSEIL